MIPISNKPVSLRTHVNVIGLFIAIVTAVSIPAGYFFVEYSAAENGLAFLAHLKANRLTHYIFNHDKDWQRQTVLLADLIEVPEANVPIDRQRIFDAAGELVLEIGAGPAYPVMTRVAPIVVVGDIVGRVEVVAGARQLAINTGVVAALSCLLGFGMFFVVQMFPRRVLKRTRGALKRTQQDLEAQNSRFGAALNNIAQGLVMFDGDQRLVVCNDPYIKMYNLSRDVVKRGCTAQELFDHRDERGNLRRGDKFRADLMAKLGNGKGFDIIVTNPDQREISIVNRPMKNGGWIATHEDITARRKAEAKISHMALHDALTNLPNRLFFREQMESRLGLLSRDQKFAVLCLDLDRFKSVNDTLGHPLGDSLLRQVAVRMSECLHEGDTIARLGGDEFAILQSNIKQPSDTIALAARLIETASTPFDLDGHQVVVGLSIGIAVAPTDAKDPDQLLKNADMAMFRAKADGRGTYRFFESEMDTLLQARRTLELDLRKALVNGEFELFYQPLVNLQTQEITSFEALIRWNHPERGLVAPLDFIPLAEETALIVPIGEWVLRQACAEAMKWPSQITISVNLSPAQFRVRNLSQMVMNALAQSGLPAQRLELEITESVLLGDNASTLETLHQLRSMGVRIAMDDFGTGYSSLSYLRSFPFDKIKIDRSFVHDLSSNKDSTAIIRAIAALGSSLGMTTTGEGVETQDELECLTREGCTEAQGYFFSKPKPASDILKILSKQQVVAKAVA